MDLELVFAPGVLKAKETTRGRCQRGMPSFTLHSASLENLLRTELGPQHPSYLLGPSQEALYPNTMLDKQSLNE